MTTQTPADLRGRARTGEWTECTTGTCLGYLQTNLAILPEAYAKEFRDFCSANPRPMPLVEMTEPGVPDGLRTAPGADLRTDAPRYRVYRYGRLDDEVTDVTELWRDDLVAFLLGCSFTAEAKLLDAGVVLRHMELGQGVGMWATSIPCTPAGRFHGPTVVSMRSIRKDQVDLATRVTADYPLAHGAPLHSGDPAAIGITDLDRPDWGDPIEVREDEVPVFWACGVTPQAAIMAARPEFAITHSPGHMFITDIPDDDTKGRSAL
ncbi:MAG: putative hydro-lyase [Streptosporangiales bacterium]|nr:putative hydro-lyase [Streptosporangiales bacterium]